MILPSLEEINERIEAGLVSVQKHPHLDLFVYNYTPRCQYERAWDEVTVQCRGLILNGNGAVVARPLPKFWNFDEHPSVHEYDEAPHNWPYIQPLPLHEPFDVYEKYDGSLGVMYGEWGHYSLATRGSFTSPQASRGTEILRRKYGHLLFDVANYTYLWEIIYPSNRIVVDYGGMEAVVLLACIETRTGKELPPEEAPVFEVRFGKIVPAKVLTARRYDGVNDFASLPASIANDREGYVVRFRGSGVRCKIKGEEYKRLHRLITGVSTRSIWELLSSGKDVDELLDRVPDEFARWVRRTADELVSAYKTTEELARLGFLAAARDSGWPLCQRKDVALEIVKRKELAPIIFRMLDSKDYSKTIWKKLYPAHARPFHEEGNDDI